eukprot:365315-Chlamydomonas_euryale.AAC.19
MLNARPTAVLNAILDATHAAMLNARPAATPTAMLNAMLNARPTAMLDARPERAALVSPCGRLAGAWLLGGRLPGCLAAGGQTGRVLGSWGAGWQGAGQPGGGRGQVRELGFHHATYPPCDVSAMRRIRHATNPPCDVAAMRHEASASVVSCDMLHIYFGGLRGARPAGGAARHEKVDREPGNTAPMPRCRCPQTAHSS